MTSYIERGPFGKVLSFMGAEHNLDVDPAGGWREDDPELNEMIDNLRKRLAEPDCPHGLPWDMCMKCGSRSDYA